MFSNESWLSRIYTIICTQALVLALLVIYSEVFLSKHRHCKVFWVFLLLVCVRDYVDGTCVW